MNRFGYKSDRVWSLLSSDSIIESEEDDSEDTIPIDFLNNLNLSGMPPHDLKLKIGAVIMLLRNLFIDIGVCNGTRMLVKRISKIKKKIKNIYKLIFSIFFKESNVLDYEIIDGYSAGKRIFIPKMKLTSLDSDLPFKFQRIQFPVVLAYAITINKSQGQTFEFIGLDLRTPVFSHGQLYVALSRVRSFNNLKVRIWSTQEQGKIKNLVGTYTKNVVYHEILK